MGTSGGTLRVVVALALSGALSLPTSGAHAQGVTAVESATPDAGDAVLARYMRALAGRRLVAEETGTIEGLGARVRAGEDAYFSGRPDDAALILYEAVESPLYADFADLEEAQGATFLLASALFDLGSLRTSARYLERLLARGVEGGLFGPAYRRRVDVALESGDLSAAIEVLGGLVAEADLPNDARSELSYLRGRHAYDRGQLAIAEAAFARISRRSRFFAGAQYLRGVIAARGGDLPTAEARFCSIASTEDTARYTFFVDDRYFAVKDLAWLALGRVAHEGRRRDDAFYYYFQVPADSDRVAEALFESAYSMYEGGDHETAIDLLDQLSARFPESPFVAEALLLRGYVQLARCEFDAADRLFQEYQSRFEPVIALMDAITESPARQSRLYSELLDAGRTDVAGRRDGGGGGSTGEGASEDEAAGAMQPISLMTLLQVDPDFYRLHARVRTLDAEAARAGRLEDDWRALRARLRGDDEPMAAAARQQYLTDAARLRDGLRDARTMLDAMTRQLDELRAAGASREQRRTLEAAVAELDQRTRQLERRLRRAIAEGAELEEPPQRDTTEDVPVEQLVRDDTRRARRFPARVAALRARLVSAANDAALVSLREARERMAQDMRRARIGRIDAIMGSKRRIEIQIESLAAGRFPAELQDALRMQGLLREDEEYWPFEGEYWADEFVEAGRDEGDLDDSPDDDNNVEVDEEGRPLGVEGGVDENGEELYE